MISESFSNDWLEWKYHENQKLKHSYRLKSLHAHIPNYSIYLFPIFFFFNWCCLKVLQTQLRKRDWLNCFEENLRHDENFRISLLNRNSEDSYRQSPARTVHSKFHIGWRSKCLCYCQFASNFLFDGWAQLITTTATNSRSFF